MMNFLVVLRVVVGEREVIRFVEEIGGSWDKERGGGTITRRSGRAHLDPIDSSTIQGEMSELETSQLEDRVGGEIGSVFSVHYSASQEGILVGEHVAFELLCRWCGCIDRSV